MTVVASVVVPTRGRSHLLHSLARGVLDQQIDGELELIVVDDCSDDDTWDVLGDLCAADPRVKRIRLPTHSGPSVARNAGWRSAGAAIVAFTDDDCLPSPGWLSALVAAHGTDIHVVQGATSPDPEQWDCRGPFSHFVNVQELSYLFESCNVSYRKPVLEELGGFDEAFGTSRGGAPFGEDADLGWRALETGASTAFAPGAVTIHQVTRSSYRRHLRGMLRRRRLVYLLRQHQGLRRMLARPWLFQASHAPALLVLIALAGLVAARNLALLVVVFLAGIAYARDWIRYRQRPGRRRAWPLTIPGFLIADIVEIGVLAAGSLQWRTLIL